MKTTTCLATIEDAEKIAELAREIWQEHYGEIFGTKRTADLIEKFQNEDAIKREISNGYSYYFVKVDNISIGYFNFIEEGDSLYCGKLYFAKDFRGKGFGREIFRAMEKRAILLGKKHLKLSVNSDSDRSVMFYRSQGMTLERIESNVIDEYLTSEDMIMSKDICPVEKSIKYFMQGYNCCQSVVMGFAPFLEMKSEQIIKMGLAFGGGFSRSRNLCGALSGIGMLISLIDGGTAPDSKDKIYAIGQDLSSKFAQKNGSILCREILSGVKNVTTTPKSQPRTAEYYATRPCVRVVENASYIMLEYLQDTHKIK